MSIRSPVPSAEYMSGSRWIAEHIDELVAKYPNHWVAAHGGRVVAADTDLGRATDEAEQRAPAADIAHHFVDDGTLIF